MGEETEIFDSESGSKDSLSHQRILVIMAGLVIAVAVGAAAYGAFGFAIGILIGGVFAFANYFWMKKTLESAFSLAAEGERPRIFGAGYILRYFVFGILIAILYIAKIAPIVAVLFGFTSFAFAVALEGLIKIFTSFNKR